MFARLIRTGHWLELKAITDVMFGAVSENRSFSENRSLSSRLLKGIASLGAVLVLASCSYLPPIDEPAEEPSSDPVLFLKQMKFTDVPGWAAADHSLILPAFLRSCEVLAKKPQDAAMGPDQRMGKISDWVEICADAKNIRPGNKVEAAFFFQSRFVPYLASNNQNATGLFTGYYEPELEGRWGPEGNFVHPIYSRPNDLVSANLGDYRDEFKGKQIAGRVLRNKLIPYNSRAEINNGALKGRGLEILWVNDPVTLFFLHVQGSGRVRMSDGSTVRIGYAGRNGRPYTSIGKELVKMNVMPLRDVTAPAIMDWLRANPDAGRRLMNKNESFVFFRVIDGEGPLGAQGIPLTPGRSMAVDRKFIPYGVPIWLNTTDPLDARLPLRRLMVAQDTGSAIKGPVRGDVFWGFGAEAAQRAGVMKSRGQYFLILPSNRVFNPESS